MVPPTVMSRATLANHVLFAFMVFETMLSSRSRTTCAFSISSPSTAASLTQRQFFSTWSSPMPTTRRSNNACSSLDLSSSSSSSADDGSQRRQPIENTQPDYSKEETLLKIHLATQLGVSTQEALQAVAKYSQSFPFSTVLPLKPLMHIPTADEGVEVKFLRRGEGDQHSVLQEKLDGGIRFFVKEISVGAGGEKTTLTFSDDDEDEDNDDKDDQQDEESSSTVLSGLDVTVKRNSVGQSKPHGVAERALVTAYLSGLTGKGGGGKEHYGSPPTEQVYVTSFYHKWMML